MTTDTAETIISAVDKSLLRTEFVRPGVKIMFSLDPHFCPMTPEEEEQMFFTADLAIKNEHGVFEITETRMEPAWHSNLELREFREMTILELGGDN